MEYVEKIEFDEETFTKPGFPNDALVIVDTDQKLYVSSQVLSARSAIFRKMFCDQEEICWDLTNWDRRTFLNFMCYVYTGRVVFTVVNVLELLRAGEVYGFPNLVSGAIKFVRNHLQANEVLNILVNAHNKDQMTVEQICWELIDQNPQVYLHANIPEEFLITILKRETIRAREIVLFRLLVKWCETHEAMGRIGEFLPYVHFSFMSHEELMHEAKIKQVLDSKTYMQALEFIINPNLFRELNPDVVVKPRTAIMPGRFLLGPDYGISENGSRVTKVGYGNGDFDYKAVCITDAVHEGVWQWNVGIRQTKFGYICIGVAPHDIDVNATGNFKKCGYYLWIRDGSLWNGCNGSVVKTYANPAKENDIVSVELDIPNKKISFAVNDLAYGVAFNSITTDKALRLVVLLDSKSDSVCLKAVGRLR